MNERATLWSAAEACLRDGVECALATVARHRGSVPMASDAKMLVTRAGRLRGTVGGGCVEADVVHQALAALDTGRPEFVRHHLNADLAGDLGLSCGGTVDLFVEPLTPAPETVALCAAVARGVEARERVVVLTALTWPDGPAKLAFVNDTVHGIGGWNPTVDPLEIWRSMGPDIAIDEGRSLFVERLSRQPRIIIFGAGHVGREIAKVAAGVGFHVAVSDDREDFANPSRLPDAHEILLGHFAEVIGSLEIDEDDYIVIATRGHHFDANIVELTAGSGARYVGLLGSRRKRAVIRKALVRAGVPESHLDRVQSPIGLEIGAETPAEIAVSVVGELVRIRRQRQPAQ